MNILVLGTIDNKGGAAQISWEIRKRLKADGHVVNTLVRYKYSNEPDVFVIPRKRYQDWLVKIFANDLRFANTNYIFDTKEYKDADIIHCHNLHSNFFNLKSLIKMSKEKIVIWTIHDLWAITGFANNSATRRNPNKKRFLLYLWDNTNRLLKQKERIYNQSKIFVVTVSKWLKNETNNSILGNKEILCIANGIDTKIFKPQNKVNVKKDFNLPLNKRIIAFGSKGCAYSIKISNDYKNNDELFFISLGNSTLLSENKNFMELTYINDKETMSKFFSAVDLFLYPTQGDTFGLVVAESMACGTPVVTHDVDAMSEIVSHKKTGYIAKYNDIEDLKNGIEYVISLSKEDYDQMCTDARSKIEADFTLEKMYEKYLELYKELLSRQNDKR